MDWLIGKTGYSFFDVWSVVHFCAWVFFGSCFWGTLHTKPNGYGISLGICFALSLVWEVIEGRLAPRYPQFWLNPESWWNSWISDPLMCVLGVSLVWLLLSRWR